jgi:cell division transport system permease protein
MGEEGVEFHSMFRVTLKRIIKSGYLSFRRNGWLSTATILVMSLVLFVLGSLLFLGAFADTVLRSIETKIDISVYFAKDAPEETILQIKRELESLPEIASVDYVSRDKALFEFRQKHKVNPLIEEALEEIGENPLEASINIRAKDSSHYAAISSFLVKKNYPEVDKVNYFENQKVFERLSAIVGTARSSGIFLVAFLAFLAVLVAFNTVRLAIYTMREEINIMRLVGASPWFVRGPFIVSGILYGSIAALLTTFSFFPLAQLVSPKLKILSPNFDLFAYFTANLLEFFGLLLAAGIALGVFSSIIAIRRYLRI